MKTTTRKQTRKTATTQAPAKANCPKPAPKIAKRSIHPAREIYLIAKALYEATKVLKRMPVRERPFSDIADMEFLIQRDFKRLVEAFQTLDEIHAARIGGDK